MLEDPINSQRNMGYGHMTKSSWRRWYVLPDSRLAVLIKFAKCLFEPRVIEFEDNRANFHPISQNVTEEILGQTESIVALLILLLIPD